MAGENYPVSGVPDADRYGQSLEQRGPAGSYRTLPATLEEEAKAGGWLPNSTPCGPTDSLDRLYTIGMRGEPDFDDDPVPAPGAGRYAD